MEEIFRRNRGGGKPKGACQTVFWLGQIPFFETILLNLNGRLNILKTKESQKSNRVYMLLSKACVYGLRAALFLAVNETDKYTPIRPMSEKLEISRSEEHTSELQSRGHLLPLPSFPTRRSSDLPFL